MSSLLQFSGNTGKHGVELQFYQTVQTFSIEQVRAWAWDTDSDTYSFDVYDVVQKSIDVECLGNDAELVPCAICGGKHNRLWVAWRKPRGMFGPWVVFEYNGEKHVPDLSIPIATFKLPHDAKPLSDAQNAEYWHRN